MQQSSLIYDNYKKQIVGGWEDREKLNNVLNELYGNETRRFIQYCENKVCKAVINEDDESIQMYLNIIDNLKLQCYNKTSMTEIRIGEKTYKRYEVLYYNNHKIHQPLGTCNCQEI